MKGTLLKTNITLAAALAFACTGACFAQNGSSSPATITLASPDHQIVVQFMTRPDKTSAKGDGRFVYTVQFHGKPVLDDSGLSLQLEDLPALGSNVHIAGSDPGQGVDDFHLENQKISNVHDVYNSVIVHLAESGTAPRSMDIEARAYNSGIAFRYLLPAQSGSNQFHLRQEDTEFRLTTDATDWLLALPNYRSSYESEYVKLPTSALSNQGGVASKFLIGLPLLMHEPGVAWLSLTEADLEGNTSMYVTNPSGGWQGHWLVSELSPSVDHPEMRWRARSLITPPGESWRSPMIRADSSSRHCSTT